MNKQITSISTLMLISLSAAAQLQWLEQPASQTLQVPAQKTTLINQSQEAVVFNQSLLGEDMPAANNRGYQAESKQFYLDVSAKQLTAGVSVPLTSDQAVIRISPLAGNSAQKTLVMGDLELSQQGQLVSPEVFVNGAQLKATGMPASEHTVAFKVNTVPGPMNLKMHGLPQSGQYMIHVLEPNSEQVMKLQTSRQAFASGEDVLITASLGQQQKQLPMQVSGYVTQPNGEQVATLKFQPNNQGGYQAVLPGMPGQSLAKGLWEVHTVSEAVVDGQKVMRDVSTAFAINLPSARFNGELSMDKQQISIGIDNAMEARYGISGVLSGYDSSGQQQPLALLMSASWLKTGSTVLSFAWPADLVAESGLRGPFRVTELKLQNQSLLAPVQTVNGGFRIPPMAVSDQR